MKSFTFLCEMKLVGSMLAMVVMAVAGCNSTVHDPEQQPVASAAMEMPDLLARPGEASPSNEYKAAQESVSRFRTKILQHPEMLRPYSELAQVYMQEARVSGKHHIYIPIARKLLDAALTKDPNEFEALITKGTLMMTLHQFEEARKLASRAISLYPRNAIAYGVLCDASVEMGEYTEAIAACDSMNAMRPDLRSYARASYLRELTGDIPGAIEAMTMAVNSAEAGDESRAWTMYTLGNLYLSQGKVDTAERVYNAVLQERPNYGFAIDGLGMVAAARKNYSEAIEDFVKASQLASEHLFIEHLGDIYLSMGESQNAGGINAKVLETFRQHEQGGWNIDREYALYCANHDLNLPDALARASRDYSRRPHNIDALDTYAWTLYKSGRAQEAVPFIEQAMALGTRKAEIHYHAGMIYQGAGERVKSIGQLKEAFKQNLYVNALYRGAARTALDSMTRLAMAE